MNFWETKKLSEMNTQEWESLCDGCGKCCLHRVQDADSGDFYDTDIACTLLDINTGRCTDYNDRHKTVPDCVRLTAKFAVTLEWLPDTCSYRLLANNQPLPEWHPLLTNDVNSVHQHGISVQSLDIISENDIECMNSHIENLFSAEIQ